jgi:hypothetical protein
MRAESQEINIVFQKTSVVSSYLSSHAHGLDVPTDITLILRNYLQIYLGHGIGPHGQVHFSTLKYSSSIPEILRFL